MKRFIYGLLMLAGSSALLAAQLYRWVDDKGNVEWRDTPPPPTAKKVEQRKIAVPPATTSPELPYSVQQAAKNFPVTLWISDCGEACDRARAHLSRRGVPHTEKSPQSNFEVFKKETGGGEVPVMFVGSNRVKGYLESEWDAALDFAGYPKTALVPIKPTIAPAPESAAADAAKDASGKPAPR